MLYFDHNATAPLLPEARDEWVRAGGEFVGNPSSLHRAGSRADRALTQAREELAEMLGCDPAEIVWTSGATEANNLAINHLARTGARRVLVSDLEHPSVLEPIRHYFRENVRSLRATTSGAVLPDSIQQGLTESAEKPDCVVLMAANNETGVLQPWQEVLEICSRANVLFFCDATQWIGKLPASGLGRCAFVSGSAHKFGGPKGVGFLKCPFALKPLLFGGKQEEGRRAGTENLPAILAMLAALKKRESTMSGGLAHRLQWRDGFETAVLQKVPGARVLGCDADRLWNTSTILFPEVDCRQRWVVKLDREGAAASTGSACASGEEKPSPVLLAMGLSANETGRAVRFSSGWETAADDWETLLTIVMKAGEKMRRS